jgi:hypothetical protein
VRVFRILLAGKRLMTPPCGVPHNAVFAATDLRFPVFIPLLDRHFQPPGAPAIIKAVIAGQERSRLAWPISPRGTLRGKRPELFLALRGRITDRPYDAG